MRHFRCTACGKCCAGWLPLTISDALLHAGRFPLAVVWTPVRQAAKDFAATERLGFTFRTPDKKTVAVRICPTAYIPPTMTCPALTADNLCAIHGAKPLRCKAMPFFPYRDEGHQADLLIPRAGWDCDVSPSAPSVYDGKTIVDRADFDAERAELLAQAPLIRSYAQRLLETVPAMGGSLAKALLKPGGGHVAVSFASLLRHLPNEDRSRIAARQIGALTEASHRLGTESGWAEYRRNYQDWAWEMERLT